MSRGGKKRAGGVEHGSFDNGYWIDPADTHCRLIVTIEAATELPPLLGIEAVAALLLCVSDEALARRQVATAHAAGRAALLIDRIDLVPALAADGVLLSRPAAVVAARRALPQGALVGAVVGGTRHDAMVAGEDGADYVVFGTPDAAPSDGIGALVEHIDWWHEVAVLPSVAAGRFTGKEVEDLVAAGADFILPARDSDPAALSALAAVLARLSVEQRPAE